MSDNDLLHYYKVLKQFLDISDDSNSRAKTNSTRAQRAREKLLKLSLAQFRELSTDVYDELRRRIDELRSEPDFLLPKLTFHPKRNQARRKLSLLPQLRFKDLVSDISFEIERRNLHIPESPSAVTHGPRNGSISHTPVDASAANVTNGLLHHEPVSQSASGAQKSTKSETYQPPADLNNDAESAHEEFQPRSEPDHEHELSNRNLAGLRDELATPDLSQVLQKSIGVQSNTVVPTKASLAWLSDESDDEHNESKGSEGEPRRLSFSNLSPRKTENLNVEKDTSSGSFRATNVLAGAGIGAASDVGAVAASRLVSGSEMAALKAENTKLAEERAQLVEEKEKLAQENATLRLQHSQWESRHKELQTQYNLLEDTHNSVLTEKSQLQVQLDTHARTRETLPDPDTVTALEKELESLKAAAAALRLENQSLKTSAPKEPRTTSRDFSNTNFYKEGETSPRAVRTLARNSSVPDINTELGNLYLKMEKLNSQKGVEPRREEELLGEVSLWRSRFEAALAGKLAQALKTFELPVLQNFVAPSGSVPLQTGTSFFSQIEALLLAISDSKLDTDSVFEKISNLAILANKITDFGGNSVLSSNDYATSVREAATHALTATRYHISYPVLLPKIVVERAVSELAFSVCDYLSVLKLNSGDEVTHTVAVPIPSEESNGAYVRPLKMTSKLSSITNLENLKKNERSFADDANVSRELNVNGALSESSPIATKVEPEVKAQPKKLSLFERILNSKVGGDSKSIDANVASKNLEQVNENVKENIEPKSPVSVPQTQGFKKLPTSPNKSSIMDKVKQFESPSQKAVSPNPSRDSPAVSVKSTRALFSNNENDTTSPLAKHKRSDSKTSEADTSGASLTRGRSIFQSLRERFTKEGEPEEKTAERANKIDAKDKSILSDSKINSENDSQVETRDRKATSSVSPVKSTIKNSPVKTDLKKSIESPVEKLESPTKLTSGNEFTSPEKESAQVETSYSSPARTQSYKKVVSGSPLLKRVDYDNDDVATEPIVDSPAKSVKSVESAAKSVKSQPDSPLANKTELNFKVKGVNGVPTKTPSFKVPSFKVKKVNYASVEPEKGSEEELDDDEREEEEARQRQEYRKSMAAATFNFDLFDIDDPDNTLTQVLLYLEHQTVQVISTIQDLLSAIKKPDATRGELRTNSKAISEVISQMTEATNTSMNQTRNHQLKEHGSWVVKSLEDCNHRMYTLCRPTAEKEDLDFADKNFKQRLAGISFDIAKCTKELVKTVEEASLKEDIAQLDARLNNPDDLT